MKSLFLIILLTSTALWAQSYEAEEVLGGVMVNDEGISVQVRSGGCTSKFSFKYLINDQVNPVEIKLVRIYNDRCKQMPFIQTITFTYDELGLDEQELIRVTNPVSNQVLFQ